MMYYVNKVVFGLLNPVTFGLILLTIGVILGWRKWRKTGLVFATLALVWFSIWSFGFIFPHLKTDLEELYPPLRAEEMPTADAIVLLGGGMGCNTNLLVYPEICQAADRVWHAARLWKAGKAPVIITSGESEEFTSVPLLLDFGVPKSAILVEPSARNTEENAKFVAEQLKAGVKEGDAPRKILLVTSALHMRRAELMFRRAFEKYAAVEGNGARPIEIIPAASDYDGLLWKDEVTIDSFFPSPEGMADKSRTFKEILGYWGYRILRK